MQERQAVGKVELAEGRNFYVYLCPQTKKLYVPGCDWAHPDEWLTIEKVVELNDLLVVAGNKLVDLLEEQNESPQLAANSG